MTEHESIGNSVAADAVRAMNGTRDFTGSIETRNNLPGLIDDLCLGVDLHAAHRMMHGRRHQRGVVRAAFIKTVFVHAGRTSHFVSGSLLAEFVPLLDCLNKVGGIDACLLGKFFKCIGLVGLARSQNVFDLDAVGIASVLVDQCTLGRRNHKEETVLLSQIGLGEHVTTFGLIDITLAVTVDINAGVFAELEARCAGLRIAGREQLNPAHLHQIGIDLFGHRDAVAGS